MIRTWTIEPPEQRPHIVSIGYLDFNLFENAYICGSERVGTFDILDGRIVHNEPAEGHLPSFSRAYPYLVQWSDGSITRGSISGIDAALTILGQECLGQEWPHPRT